MTSEALAPRLTLKLPRLYPKQHAALFDPARISCIEASTKSGKTVGGIDWLLDQSWRGGKPGRAYWWVATTYRVSLIAFKRMCRMLFRSDPRRTIWRENKGDITITLTNGAVIVFLSADSPDSLYGEDVWAAVIDEASRCKEEAWHAIRTTLTATRGPLRIIGNVRGRKNWAYKLARRAEAGEPGYAYHKLIAADAIEAGILDEDEVESARRDLPEAVFRELYLAEASDDQGNPFGYEALRRVAIQGLAKGPVGVYGVDLAKSVNWTVNVGLNQQRHVCHLERWQSDWGKTRSRLVGTIKGTPALVDSTGVGDPIVEDLQRECQSVEGFKFTSLSKQQLMEGLAAAIQSGEAGIPEGWLMAEHESFEYEYTRTGVRYCAPAGMNDDGVMAHALALFHSHHAIMGDIPVRLIQFADDDDDEDEDPRW